MRELKAVVPALSDDPAGRVAALAEATVHDNWRVRSALHELLPAVAVARGRDAFEQQLLEGLVRAFQDRIAEVRSAAVRAAAPKSPASGDVPASAAAGPAASDANRTDRRRL